MKKILGLLIGLMVLVTPVLGIEETDLPDPGVTPDSIFYGLDRAMERIDLALTFDRAEKAKKGLNHALERLAEVEAMIEAKKIDAAEIAQVAHDDQIEEIETEIEGLEEEDEITEIGERLNEHRTIVQRVNERITVKTKGELTEEQETLIAELIASMENSVGRLKIEIENKKGEIRTRIKERTGEDDDEIDDEDEVDNIDDENEVDNDDSDEEDETDDVDEEDDEDEVNDLDDDSDEESDDEE